MTKVESPIIQRQTTCLPQKAKREKSAKQRVRVIAYQLPRSRTKISVREIGRQLRMWEWRMPRVISRAQGACVVSKITSMGRRHLPHRGLSHRFWTFRSKKMAILLSCIHQCSKSIRHPLISSTRLKIRKVPSRWYSMQIKMRLSNTPRITGVPTWTP